MRLARCSVQGISYLELLNAAKYQAAGVRELFDDLLGNYPPTIQQAKTEFDHTERWSVEFEEAGTKLIRVIDSELQQIDEQGKAPSYSTPEWREVRSMRLNEDRQRLIGLKARVKSDLERFPARQTAPF
jgi:hypothetical protein